MRDKERGAATAFGNAARTYDSAAVVQRDVAAALDGMLEGLLQHGDKVLEIGCGTGLLSAALARRIGIEGLTVNDLSGEMMSVCLERIGRESRHFVGDAETVAWPEGQDGVVSSSAVQWFDSPLAFLDKAHTALRDGGIAALATYGPSTFGELRGGRPDTEGYPTAEQWISAAEQRFTLLRSERRTAVQRFGSRTDMLRSIVLSGVGGRRKTAQSAPVKERADDGWKLTYEELFFVWRKA